MALTRVQTPGSIHKVKIMSFSILDYFYLNLNLTLYKQALFVNHELQKAVGFGIGIINASDGRIITAALLRAWCVCLLTLVTLRLTINLIVNSDHI